MTRDEIIFKRNLSLIRAAEQTTVSKACRLFGVSRTIYYRLLNRYMQYGREGLKVKPSEPPEMPNKISNEIEQQVIAYSIEHPTYGRMRVSTELMMIGTEVSDGCVQRIFTRNNMRTVKERLKLFEERYKDNWNELDEETIRLLVQNSSTMKEQHVISHHPGYLLCQDTFRMGYLKGIGSIYAQVVVDTYGSFAFAKIYNRKSQKESSDILVDKVLPFYESLGIPVRRMLTDNGSEYCGTEYHHYEALLCALGIEHSRTKIQNPRTNGFVERFNRTLKNEFLIIHYSQKWYQSIDEMQFDLDKWLSYYNFYRTHQGYRAKGRTPAQVLLDFTNMPKVIS